MVASVGTNWGRRHSKPNRYTGGRDRNLPHPPPAQCRPKNLLVVRLNYVAHHKVYRIQGLSTPCGVCCIVLHTLHDVANTTRCPHPLNTVCRICASLLSVLTSKLSASTLCRGETVICVSSRSFTRMYRSSQCCNVLHVEVIGAHLYLSDLGAQQLIIVRGMKREAHNAGDYSD